MRPGAIFICMLLCSMIICACGAKDLSEDSSGGAGSGQSIGALVGDPAAQADSIDEANAGDGTVIASGAVPESDPEPAPMSMEKDMGISINGQWFPIWQDSEKLLQALGEDFEMWSAPSCVFEGEDKEFAFDGCSVYTNPDGDRDIWYSILLENDEFSTARGIRVGSALDEIISAYGDRYYWEGESQLTYSISGEEGDIASPCILFTIEEGCVAAIEIYYPTNVS